MKTEKSMVEKEAAFKVETAIESDSSRSRWVYVSNGDYGPFACVNPDYGYGASRQWCTQKRSRQTQLLLLKRGVLHNLAQAHLVGHLKCLTGLRYLALRWIQLLENSVGRASTIRACKSLSHPKIVWGDFAVTHSQSNGHVVTVRGSSVGVHLRYGELTLWMLDTGNHMYHNVTEDA